MPIRAVLFDLDDTLLDWSARTIGWFDDPEGHHKHLERAARTYAPNLTQTQLLALRESFVAEMEDLLSGDIVEAPHLGKMLARHLHKTTLTPTLLTPEEALEAYGWEKTPGVEVFPDVMDVLPQLKDMGLKVGLITNGFQPIAMRDRELAAYGLLEWLPDCRFSSADVGFLKPDGRIFQLALDCLNVEAAEAVYIGDSIYNDVMGAQNAGLKGVWRPRQGSTMSSAGWVKPDGIISTLHDLIPMIKKWNEG